MSEAHTPEETSTSGMLVHTRREREFAVSHWLLAAAPDMRTARAEWVASGVTLLRCGGIFSAVRVRAELVHAAAGSTRAEDVDAYLAEVLHGGPVFIDRYSQRYYALVPASTARRWDAREAPDVECLGRDCYLPVNTGTSGLAVRNALTGRRGFPGVRLRWSPYPDTCHTVEWGATPPRHDDRARGDFYGYSAEAVAGFFAQTPIAAPVCP